MRTRMKTYLNMTVMTVTAQDLTISYHLISMLKELKEKFIF